MSRKSSMAIWNNTDFSTLGYSYGLDKPDVLFEVNDSDYDFTLKVINAKVGMTDDILYKDDKATFRGRYSPRTNSILLNHNQLKNDDLQDISITGAHELGHALGLDDLYIGKNHSTVIGGGLVDNSDKLMFGIGDKVVKSPAFMDYDDKLGVALIHRWIDPENLFGDGGSNDIEERDVMYASYNYYAPSDLELYSDIIVIGKITSVEDCIENQDAHYSELTIDVDDYLKVENASFQDEIIFFQDGSSEAYFQENDVMGVGDEVLLYLVRQGDYLVLLGGPQGRFNVHSLGSTKFITNQLDEYIGNKVLGFTLNSSNIDDFNALTYNEYLTKNNLSKVQEPSTEYEITDPNPGSGITPIDPRLKF